MPKLAINFNNCVIYKIVCNDLNVKELYVGSTTDFSKRKSHHKKNCNRNTNDDIFNTKLYQMIKKHGGWDNWVMLEIEKFPCNDSNEARTRQRFWLEQLQASLNMINPIRTQEDNKAKCKKYNENNQDKIIQYREDNKVKFQEIRSVKHNCICGGVYTTGHKVEHMRYKKHIKYMEKLLLEPIQNTV